ncbi:histidine decarboxylase [Dendronalium sp. ChiSLP03b]|uniref:histidine decarboxylase n=1 Tax=Dendronalium sp. ChiSLP03b TaxID=3075381 RepID=UPI002AD46A19|nr:histidine decarboxylase [Dendronalium sp. ChiSLP03b]MDZ8208099.1 histidine decarboxylase [Dendronalium sp. ChiSLP03b]
MSSSDLSIDVLLQRLQSRSKLHAGYPYNLAFDYQHILPLLQYTLNNLGDAYVEGNYGINAKDFEREVISFFAGLYHLEKDDTWGYVTSCGTEGNLYGILLGRELYPDGILYGSADCHYSVVKAARMFRIPFVEVKSQSHGEIDYSSLRQALANNRNKPAIINVNVGTTITGAVDDISKIVQILAELNISQFHIHVDGALGGMLIPYMEGATPLDFSQYPIGSIAVSGHKFIGSPIPCGVVLARKQKVQSFDIEYLGSTDTTITGSRNGLTPVILWDAIQQRQHLFKEEVLRCRQLAEYFQNKIAELGHFALLNPFSTTVVFERPEKLIEKRWQLACYGRIAHIVVMQNHNELILKQLLQELDLMSVIAA